MRHEARDTRFVTWLFEEWRYGSLLIGIPTISGVVRYALDARSRSAMQQKSTLGSLLFDTRALNLCVTFD